MFGGVCLNGLNLEKTRPRFFSKKNSFFKKKHISRFECASARWMKPMPNNFILPFIVLSLFLVSFAAPNYYRDSHWCGRGLQFLEDSQCAKVFPSQYQRTPSSACPILARSAPAADGWQRDPGNVSDFRINTTAFQGLGISSNLCVTLVRRVDGVPFYRHLCGAQVHIMCRVASRFTWPL